MGQRCTKTRLNVRVVAHNVTGFGSVAYRVTDTHGCIPFDGIGYLEKGARAHAFTLIIFFQVIYSCYASLFQLCAYAPTGGNSSGEENSEEESGLMGRKAVFAFHTIVISSILLIYEAVIATKGRPVVISGNCMLVELDPRLGFLDSEIDGWWKALVGMTGL